MRRTPSYAAINAKRGAKDACRAQSADHVGAMTPLSISGVARAAGVAEHSSLALPSCSAGRGGGSCGGVEPGVGSAAHACAGCGVMVASSIAPSGMIATKGCGPLRGGGGSRRRRRGVRCTEGRVVAACSACSRLYAAYRAQYTHARSSEVLAMNERPICESERCGRREMR